ncbi:MAG: hypothetical protein IT343_08585 [Candidatus Melainabacteria bacterium]|jgi:hypothetical protein|nr:hypothetical protein [Candidatus Melainabacteria bacterium]
MTEFEQTLILASTGVFIFAGLLAFAQHFLHLFFGRPPAPNQVFVRWLTEEQKEKLRLASIPYTPSSVATGEDGLSFSPQSFARAKRLLGARVVEVFKSSNRNVEEAVLTFSCRRDHALRGFKTEVAGSIKWYDFRRRLKHRRLATFIDEVLMPSVRKDIVVHLQHGRHADPATDGKFHVYLYSTPTNHNQHAYIPNRLLGAQFGNQTAALVASGTGVPVLEPLTNFAVAELVDNNLYVHLDIVNGRNLIARRGLLLRILQQVEGELAADKFLEDLIGSVKAENEIVLEGETADFRVEGEGITGRRLVVLSSLVREILTPVVRSNVIIRDCNGQNAAPVDDGKFRIFMHSSPIGAPCMNAPEQIWGHRMIKREAAFAPSAHGVPLIDDNGFIVGEIVGRNLYLHMHYIHFGAKLEAALAAKLLLEVRKEVQAAAVEADEDAIKRRVAEHYVQECTRQYAVGKALKVSAGDLAAAQSDFHGHLRGALLEEFDLLRLQAAPAEEIGREFDELTQLANVTGVKVEGDKIVVSTDVLYCVHPRSHVRYEIGAFDIQICTSTNMIKWFNKTRKVSGGSGKMNAPHVDPNGNACMGNTKDLFPALIQKREFASAVQLAIAFVEAVNLEDNWGAYITNWPVAR